MNKIKNTLMVGLLVSLAFLITGCGGGSGGAVAATDPGVVSVITGIVSDGPIKNSRVFLDLNYNGVFDSGEPNDISDAEGKFAIEYILDPGIEYMLIAEGSNTLATVDPLDNAAAGNLNFVMFAPIKATGDIQLGASVAQNYSQDLNPKTFQTYLKELDTKLLNGLSASSSDVAKLVTDTTSSTQDLFKNLILDKSPAPSATSNPLAQKLKEIVKLTSDENKIEESTKSKTQIGLSAENEISFSEKSTDNLTSDLSFINKTTPAKIGDLVVVKKLVEVVTKASQYKVFVTPYKSLIDIPKYDLLRDAGYQVVMGADIILKNASGKNVKSVVDANIVSEVIDSYNFSDINKMGLTYLRFDGTAWQSVASNINVTGTKSENLKAQLQLAPFVLAQANGMQAASNTTINGYNVLKTPVVIAKGHFTGTVDSTSGNSIFKTNSASLKQTIDIALLVNNSVTLRIPTNFALDEVTVLSQDLSKVTTAGKVSVDIKVKTDGSVEETNDAAIILIDDATLISDLSQGNGIEGNGGLKAYIQTKIPYETLSVGLDDTIDTANATLANNLIITNSNAFLGGNSVFNALNTTSISWNRTVTTGVENYTFVVDQGAQSLTLTKEYLEANLLTSTKTVVWTFAGSKVIRSRALVFHRGEKVDTSLSSTVTYTKNGSNTLNAVFDDIRAEYYKSASTTYANQLDARYRGTANFTIDANYNVVAVVNSKYTQKHSETNSLNKPNSLNGVVIVDSGSLTFDGDFSFYFKSYGSISGFVLLKADKLATVKKGYTNGYYNDNTLPNGAVFIVKVKPTKLASGVEPNFIGQWTGPLTDSCGTDGTMIVNISANNQSWAGQNGANTTQYGAALTTSGTSISFLNDNNSFSTGVLNAANTQITGNWTSGQCNGTYTLDKQ